MLKYWGKVTDFWQEDLQNYKWPESVSTGQNENFHNAYFDESNNLMQGFDDQLPTCCNRFFEELYIEDKAISNISWIQIKPSGTIPVHADKFFKLRKKHNVDIDDCVRYLIFLDDWTLGHLVEFEQQPITKWEKGDVWTFTHDDLHCAGNASNHNFNTCQVNTRK